MTVVDTLKVRLELVNNTSKALASVANNLKSLEIKMKNVERASGKVVEKQNQMTRAVDNTVISARELYHALISWGVAYSSINIARSITETSDSITLATARLGLLTDDVQELSDTIYQMSQNARTNYLDMLNVVAKMGINVGVGEGEWFANTDELVKFNELVSKTFAIGGQNTKEINSAMLQLTQALSSGRLQGDEFRSLFENSPLYVKYIGEYLGELYGATDKFGNSIALTNGQLKELGAQGLLTSDILIDAMFYAADEIEEKFESIPRTFAQRFEQVRNMIIQQGKNLLDTINGIVNNASFDKFLTHFSNQITFIIGLIDSVMTALSPIIQFVLANWNIMGPLILVVAGAMAYFAIKTELSANTLFAHEMAARRDALAIRLVATSQKMASATSEAWYLTTLALKAALDKKYRTSLKISLDTKKQIAISKLAIRLFHNETMMVMASTIAMRLYNLSQKENIFGRALRLVLQKLNILGYLKEATAASIATAAVTALNMAIMYIAIPLGIALAIIWLVVKAMNYATDSSYTLAGVLMGTLGVAVAVLTDAVIFLYNSLVALGNLGSGLFTGDFNRFEYMEYKSVTQPWIDANKKYSNNSMLDYSMDNQDYSTVLNDDLMAGIDGILGNTGEIADNTSMTSQDVEFLRAMAENRVITRMNTMTINITNNNEMNVNSEMDLDGISERVADSLTEAFYNSARGVHL